MKRCALIDIVFLRAVVIFLFTFLAPKYFLAKTTTTGGDMGSHYPTAVYSPTTKA